MTRTNGHLRVSPEAAWPTLLGPVEGLEGAVILGPCTLGHPTRNGPAEPLRLGPGVVIRAGAVIYQGTRLGARVQVGHGVLIREDNLIGDDVSIGSGSNLEPGNRIGARTRIHSGCFLASATVGEDVFCGPHVVFTDDPHPPCPHWPLCRSGVVVERGASVGANVTLLPGVVLGERSLVGGGSVVTRSVAPNAVVAGNPARRLGFRDQLRCTGPKRREFSTV